MTIVPPLFTIIFCPPHAVRQNISLALVGSIFRLIGSARGNDGAVAVVVAFGAVVGPVPVCVRVFWDEALKAADCVSAVAEHARLIGFRWLA